MHFGASAGRADARGRSRRSASLIPSQALSIQSGHIDDKAVFHVAFDGAVIGFVHFFHCDHFDIAGDVVLAAKIKHLLRFRQSANQ